MPTITVWWDLVKEPLDIGPSRLTVIHTEVQRRIQESLERLRARKKWQEVVEVPPEMGGGKYVINCTVKSIEDGTNMVCAYVERAVKGKRGNPLTR